LKVLCDEHGIGGDGECCVRQRRVAPPHKLVYLEASGDKYVPRAVLFDLEPGVIDTVRASPIGELLRPGNIANQNAGAGNN
jgi:tubulin beta